MFFTDSHEWICVEEGIGIVGITAHAQKELGEIVFVDLPPVGKQLRAGEEVAVLESTKAAADIYSPVSGEVVAVNTVLKADVDLLNRSPERDGWLFKIKVTKSSEFEELMNQEQYAALIT
jgi:glycine cleavage system H protein